MGARYQIPNNEKQEKKKKKRGNGDIWVNVIKSNGNNYGCKWNSGYMWESG